MAHSSIQALICFSQSAAKHLAGHEPPALMRAGIPCLLRIGSGEDPSIELPGNDLLWAAAPPALQEMMHQKFDVRFGGRVSRASMMATPRRPTFRDFGRGKDQGDVAQSVSAEDEEAPAAVAPPPPPPAAAAPQEAAAPPASATTGAAFRRRASRKQLACAVCGKTARDGAALRRCAGCGRVTRVCYCSQEHCRRHWVVMGHRRQCEEVQLRLKAAGQGGGTLEGGLGSMRDGNGASTEPRD
jgi:hypothetical protein